jgi:hypothetical protein
MRCAHPAYDALCRHMTMCCAPMTMGRAATWRFGFAATLP